MSNIQEARRLLADERATQVLQRLHRLSNRQWGSLLTRLAPQLGSLLLGRPLSWDWLTPKLSDLALAVDAKSGLFAYIVARAIRARRIVEYGSSLGVSAIYYGLAVRHNGGGQVVGSEIVPEKADLARRHIHEAGLADVVEIRTGDAQDTLATVEGPIDLLHNDGFPPAMLPVTQMLAPRMRPGAIVIAGNVALFPSAHVSYVAWLRNPSNGFISTRLPIAMGGEFSIRQVAAPRSLTDAQTASDAGPCQTRNEPPEERGASKVQRPNTCTRCTPRGEGSAR